MRRPVHEILLILVSNYAVVGLAATGPTASPTAIGLFLHSIIILAPLGIGLERGKNFKR